MHNLHFAGTVHPIDGVDIWPSLMTNVEPDRIWLPTTERSLIWTFNKDIMYKLIVDEKKTNRFEANGSQ